MSTTSGPLEVKVCIIGDTDVGKTSLSMRYCHGEFPENATPTIGASFLQRRVAVDGTEISLQIWDTAGQERFRSMAPMVTIFTSNSCSSMFLLFCHLNHIFTFSSPIIS